MNDLWLHRKQLICLRHHGSRVQPERVNMGGGERERLHPLKKMKEWRNNPSEIHSYLIHHTQWLSCHRCHFVTVIIIEMSDGYKEELFHNHAWKWFFCTDYLSLILDYSLSWLSILTLFSSYFSFFLHILSFFFSKHWHICQSCDLLACRTVLTHQVTFVVTHCSCCCSQIPIPGDFTASTSTQAHPCFFLCLVCEAPLWLLQIKMA